MKQLTTPWRNFFRSFAHYYDDLFLWTLLSFVQAIALLTVILAPPVAAGLNVLGSRSAKEQRLGFEFFKDGFRTYFWMSYKVLLVWIAVLGLLVVNIYFYNTRLQGMLQLVSLLWVYLVLFWVTILPLLLPLVIEMREPTVWQVYRNAIVVVFSKPVYMLMLLVQLALLTILTRYIILLLLLIVPALYVLLGNMALQFAIEEAPDSPPPTT